MKSISVLALAAMAMGPLALAAQATDTRMGGSKVTACSKFHKGKCTTASVKNTPLGQKVRLKGGSEVWCSGDCRDTLRKSTVDFWMEQKLIN